jgi:hypothetical protein
VKEPSEASGAGGGKVRGRKVEPRRRARGHPGLIPGDVAGPAKPRTARGRRIRLGNSAPTTRLARNKGRGFGREAKDWLRTWLAGRYTPGRFYILPYKAPGAHPSALDGGRGDPGARHFGN